MMVMVGRSSAAAKLHTERISARVRMRDRNFFMVILLIFSTVRVLIFYIFKGWALK
jgi:hypothetical protein